MFKLDIDSKRLKYVSYSIRFCKKEEHDKLVGFIKTNWNVDHIFVKNPEILKWQHLQDNQYNFVVANHDLTDKFHAVLGIVSTSFFAEGKLKHGDDIWLAIWKVNKDLSEDKSIGTELLEFVKSTLSPRTISAIGINSEVAMLYKLMGFRVGHLSQSFILNAYMEEFNIARIEKKHLKESGENLVTQIASKLIQFEEVPAKDLLNYSSVVRQQLPRKTIEYVIGRYVNHPKYSYNYHAVVRCGIPIALFVVRKIFVGASSCLRIVDFFSPDSIQEHLFSQFQKLLVRENSEYIDFVSAGIGDDVIKRLGFVKCSVEGYVPHLFEPFSPDLTKIQFACNAKNIDDFFCVFKGDSDLDRPN